MAKTQASQKTIPCRICGEQTPMLGTKLCDRCWELETRIHHDPELARKILFAMSKPEIDEGLLLTDEEIDELRAKADKEPIAPDFDIALCEAQLSKAQARCEKRVGEIFEEIERLFPVLGFNDEGKYDKQIKAYQALKSRYLKGKREG